MTNKFNVAVLAQLVERMAFNHVVVGSIPTDGDFVFSLTFASGQFTDPFLFHGNNWSRVFFFPS